MLNKLILPSLLYLHKLLSLQNLRNQEQGFRKLEFQVKDSAITWGGFNIYDGNIFKYSRVESNWCTPTIKGYLPLT